MFKAADVELSQRPFSVRQARDIVRDLFEPRPWIYWTDLLVTMAIGIFCLRQLRQNDFLTPLQTLGYIGAVLAFYRAGSFTHELVHLRTGSFLAFRVAWNLLCGIPFLMPSFMYYPHIAHHAKNHYATEEDGEYLPLATGPARNIIWYMLQTFLIPVVYVLRFLVFVPLAWFIPGFRRFVQQRVSSLVMDPRFIRPLPSAKELKIWRVQETCCFLLTAGAAAMLISGRLEISYLLKIYLLAWGVMMMNQVRTLGAHRFWYRHEEVTYLEQLLDSVNYPNGSWITAIWAPVGLRYHALHHLFPSLPYHALAEAHRRLMEQLPADSAYRETNSPSLRASLRALWRSAKASGARAASAKPTVGLEPARGVQLRAEAELGS
jgi:fatty acid desaturase